MPVDETCTPGESEACYTGPAGTEGQGVCHGGTRSCDVDGRWGDCLAEVVPAPEDCTTATSDEDCDGSMWAGDGDGDCVCEPGGVAACYTGPSGTEGVGACHGGSWTCNADGLGYGPCVGEVLPAMQEVCGDAVLDETCDGVTCPGDVVWALAAGETGAQYAFDVAVDSGGNVLVAGIFLGDFTIGATTLTSDGADSFILKLDPDGALIWAKQLGGAGQQTVRSVAVDENGNVYYTGYFDGSLSIDAVTLTTDEPTGDIDVVIGKLDPQGVVSWTSKFGTGDSLDDDQLAYGIAVHGEDNVVVTGAFNGIMTYTGPGGNTVPTVDVGNANFDLFVAHTGAAGALQWFKNFGSSGQAQSGRKVAYGGEIHVVGDGEGTFDVGATQLVNGNVADVLALSFDPTNGEPATAAHFGTSAGNEARGLDIALDPAGGVLLTGYYDGTIDFGGGSFASTGQSRFVTKRSSTGQHIWSIGFPAATSLSSNSLGAGIAADAAGNVLLTGHFSSTTDLGGGPLIATDSDIYVAKLAPDGAHVWSRSFGKVFDQFSVAVAADPTGHAVVVGNFHGQLDFGITTLAANGPSTLFIAKLAP